MLFNLCLHTNDFFRRVDAALWFRNQSSLTRRPSRLALHDSDKQVQSSCVAIAVFSMLPKQSPWCEGSENQRQALLKMNQLLTKGHNYCSQKTEKKNVILDTDEVHGMKFNKVLLNLCKGLMILQQITVWSLSFENHCCSCWDCVIVVRGQHMLSGVISNTYLFLNLNFSIISV